MMAFVAGAIELAEPLAGEAEGLDLRVTARDEIANEHVVMETEFVGDLIARRRIEHGAGNRLAGTRIVGHDQPAA
jgi:hypothetical protein